MASSSRRGIWVMPLIVAALIAGSLGYHALRGDRHDAGQCPPLRPGTNNAAADYMDLIVWHGATYVVDHDAPEDVRIGARVTTVGCSIAELTRKNHQLVGPMPWPDRTATFLPSGTAVFSVQGVRTACELAVARDKSAVVYASDRGGC